MEYKTEQEIFWAGKFGNEYILRNREDNCLASDIHFFSNIFRRMEKINTVIELGANIGLNLKAMKQLVPGLHCAAVEINENACKELKNIANEIFRQSILDDIPSRKYDVVLCKGILIHINPDELRNVYRKIYDFSSKYIIIGEYYNPKPLTVTYRGNEDRLFKRDFAGELLDLFPDLKLIDYGFQYHRDRCFPMDDVNWFLLEK